MSLYIFLLLLPLSIHAEFIMFTGSILRPVLFYVPIIVDSPLECYGYCNIGAWVGCNSWQVQTLQNGTKICTLNNDNVVRFSGVVNANITNVDYTWGFGGCRQCAFNSVCIMDGPNITCECMAGYLGGGSIIGPNIGCVAPQASSCVTNASVVGGTCVCNAGFHGDGLITGTGCSTTTVSGALNGTDFNRGDIGLVWLPKGMHEYECQQQCNLFPGCTRWSFEVGTNVCYLKDDSVIVQSNPNVIAGLGGCSLCAANSTCTQTNRTFACTCDPGFVGDGLSNCLYAPTSPPTTPPPTTQPPSTQAPTTQPPTTQPPTTQPSTTQPVTTTQQPTKQPTTQPATTTPIITLPPSTDVPTTTQPTTVPPLLCSELPGSCASSGGLLQTNKTFNGTNIIVSGNLIIGSTVVLTNSTILISGSLNLAPNAVLNVSSDGSGPAINSASDVTLNGSINVQIHGVDQLNFTAAGTYNYTVIVSDTGINGQFSNVSVDLETSSSSSGCQKKSYSSQTSYTAKSLNIVVTQSTSNACGPPQKWQTWMYGLIGGAVGLVAIIVGLVLWKHKGREKSDRFTVNF